MRGNFNGCIDNVKVLGHPRSGNHFVAALVNENFIGWHEYVFLVRDRCHNLWDTLDADTKFIYVYRDVNDVLNSVYGLRGRFGLDVHDFGKFVSTRYCDMFSEDVRARVCCNYITSKMTVTEKSREFKAVEYRPPQWHRIHLLHYRKLSEIYDNLLMISYESFMKNFQGAMTTISGFLGSTRRKFNPIREKVGWYV